MTDQNKPYKTDIANKAWFGMFQEAKNIQHTQLGEIPDSFDDHERFSAVVVIRKNFFENIAESYKTAASIEMEYQRNVAMMIACQPRDEG